MVAGLLAAVGLFLLSCGAGEKPSGLAEESPPPLSEARVEGTFLIAGTYPAELTFTPECPSGPCGVRAVGMRPNILLAEPEGKNFDVPGATTKGTPLIYASEKPRVPVDLEFAYDGERYGGSIGFEEACVFTDPEFLVPAMFAYEFEVTHAELIGAQWRATELAVSTEFRTSKDTYDSGFFRFVCLPQRDADQSTATLQD